MDETSAHICTFVDLFTSRVGEISDITEAHRGDVLKKILFVTLLDSLRRTASRCTQQKLDFSQFIVGYTSWSDATKISLPHFRAALRLQPIVDTSDSQVKNLMTAVDKKYAAWLSTVTHPFNLPEALHLVELQDNEPMAMHALSVENDIDESWIETFCPLTKVAPINKWFQHASMLKKFRNCLVHEYRNLGVNNRSERFDVPHYEHIVCRDPKSGKMEAYFNLVYPCKFIYNVVTTALENVRQQLTDRQCNPFDSWPKHEVYWIREFNQSTLLPRY